MSTPSKSYFAERYRRNGATFDIALLAAARAAAAQDVIRGGAAGIAEREFGSLAAAILLRAPSEPIKAEETTAALANNAWLDFLPDLKSAGSNLIAAGISAGNSSAANIVIPVRDGPIQPSVWVAQGGAIPVGQSSFVAAQVGPVHKLAIIFVLTSQLIAYENVFRALARESIALGLDTALFSDAAATDDNPPGLLFGVTPISASAATSPQEAMLSDLEALSGAIADNGGNEVVYIAAVRQANAARLRLSSRTGVTVWASPALAEGTVIAVEPASFVSAFGSIPKISASEQATVHMDDAPSPLSATGTPNVVSAPIRSLFNTDCIGVRAILDCSWGMRATGRVQFIADATWGSAA